MDAPTRRRYRGATLDVSAQRHTVHSGGSSWPHLRELGSPAWKRRAITRSTRRRSPGREVAWTDVMNAVDPRPLDWLASVFRRIVNESGNPVGFDARARSMEWIHDNAPALGGARPIDCMVTAEGRALVETLVLRMQSLPTADRPRPQHAGLSTVCRTGFHPPMEGQSLNGSPFANAPGAPGGPTLAQLPPAAFPASADRVNASASSKAACGLPLWPTPS